MRCVTLYVISSVSYVICLTEYPVWCWMSHLVTVAWHVWQNTPAWHWLSPLVSYAWHFWQYALHDIGCRIYVPSVGYVTCFDVIPCTTPSLISSVSCMTCLTPSVISSVSCMTCLTEYPAWRRLSVTPHPSPAHAPTVCHHRTEHDAPVNCQWCR